MLVLPRVWGVGRIFLMDPLHYLFGLGERDTGQEYTVDSKHYLYEALVVFLLPAVFLSSVSDLALLCVSYLTFMQVHR